MYLKPLLCQQWFAFVLTLFFTVLINPIDYQLSHNETVTISENIDNECLHIFDKNYSQSDICIGVFHEINYTNELIDNAYSIDSYKRKIYRYF